MRLVFHTNKFSAYTLVFLVVALGVLRFSFQQTNILSYDYFGLYLYLPATFIYHDPGISDLSWLQEIIGNYQNTHSLYQIQSEGDYNLIRFFCGMAMLLSPFFFLGHLIALSTSYPADGFSYPYQLAMMIAAYFYIVVGLIFMRKVLLHFFQDKVVAVTLLAMYLGTNLLFWTTFDAGAPHTILFTLYALLIWYSIKWHEQPKIIFAVAVGLLLGLIIVSRPTDIIAVFIPLLYGIYDRDSAVKKWRTLRTHFHHVFVLVGATFLMGLPQLVYYYYYTGQFFLSTYNDPQSGFDFMHPRFIWVLFSYRKGWFLYAPLMALSIIGLFYARRKSPELFYVLLFHTLTNLYLIASFTSLISYGWRAFIQSYALLAIPFAAMVLFLMKQKLLLRLALIPILAFFIWLSAIQGYQTIMEILHSTRMTKEYYWQVFGKQRIVLEDLKLLRPDAYEDDINGNKITSEGVFQKRELASYTFDENGNYKDPIDSTNSVFILSSETPFSPCIKIPHREISDNDLVWYRISFRYFVEKQTQEMDLLLIATYTYQGTRKKAKGKVYKYRSFPINTTETNKWHFFEIDYLSPEISTFDDRFESYLWNRGITKVIIDDFKVQVFD